MMEGRLLWGLLFYIGNYCYFVFLIFKNFLNLKDKVEQKKIQRETISAGLLFIHSKSCYNAQGLDHDNARS